MNSGKKVIKKNNKVKKTEPCSSHVAALLLTLIKSNYTTGHGAYTDSDYFYHESLLNGTTTFFDNFNHFTVMQELPDRLGTVFINRLSIQDFKIFYKLYETIKQSCFKDIWYFKHENNEIKNIFLKINLISLDNDDPLNYRILYIVFDNTFKVTSFTMKDYQSSVVFEHTQFLFDNIELLLLANYINPVNQNILELFPECSVIGVYDYNSESFLQRLKLMEMITF